MKTNRKNRIYSKTTPQKTKKNRDKISIYKYLHEDVTVSKSCNIQSEYIRDSIKYMFLANGGAITAFLIKFDTYEFRIPLILFSFGVAYSILVSIFMHIRFNICNINLSMKIDVQLFKIVKKISIVTFGIFIYIPVILFLFGIMETISVFIQNTSVPSI